MQRTPSKKDVAEPDLGLPARSVCLIPRNPLKLDVLVRGCQLPPTGRGAPRAGDPQPPRRPGCRGGTTRWWHGTPRRPSSRWCAWAGRWSAPASQAVQRVCARAAALRGKANEVSQTRTRAHAAGTALLQAGCWEARAAHSHTTDRDLPLPAGRRPAARCWSLTSSPAAGATAWSFPAPRCGCSTPQTAAASSC